MDFHLSQSLYRNLCCLLAWSPLITLFCPEDAMLSVSKARIDKMSNHINSKRQEMQ